LAAALQRDFGSFAAFLFVVAGSISHYVGVLVYVALR
jgi:hypothetical protein